MKMFLANLLRRRCFSSLPLLLITIVVLGFCSSQVSVSLAAAGSKVEYLPGFQHEGPLPFELETGYIGVGESEDVQLFYYFVKSESNPSVDPVVLWISGGPGCSSLFALIQELGPLSFDIPKNNWTLPTLSRNPYSWTKVASFIFLDLPVGTGFSYAKSSHNYTSNSVETGDHGAEFIRKWLVDHFEYQSNSFYVGGDSYSGITVPIVVQAISYGIDARFKPQINLKGYFVGNGLTYPIDQDDYDIQMAHGLGLISDEFFKSLEECGGNRQKMASDPNCKLISKIFLVMTLLNFPENALETNCLLKEENDASSEQSSVAKRFRGFNVHAFDRYLICNGPGIAYRWANHDSVQEALHVRKGSIEKWVQCREFEFPFEKTVDDSRPYHANLSRKGYRSLIYSGDRDLYIPSLSHEAWTKSLTYSIIDDWRPWFVNNQIVGYTRTFSNNMTYAKIKGSGHIAPIFTPFECFVMFKRWISYEKL